MRKIRLNDLLFDSIIENRDIARCLYFVGFGSYLLIRSWDSTMFPRVSALKTLGAVLFFICISAKIVLCDKFEKREFFAYFCVLLVSLLSFIFGRDIHFPFLCLLIMGSKGVSFKDILKEFLLVTIPVYICAVLASLTGLIENLSWDLYETTHFAYWELGESHALGMIHTTDHAAKVFFIVLAAYYLFSGKQKIIIPAIIGCISILVYVITRGGLDSGCLAILAAIVLLDIIIKRAGKQGLQQLWKGAWKIIGFIAMPVAVIVSLAACYFYNAENPVTFRVNSIFSGRLSLGKDFFNNYSVSLFGHDIEMVGVGGIGRELVQSGVSYCFMDISYQQILMINGLLALLIVIGFYVLISRKYKDDVPMQICISLISLNCMVAHHLIDISYIPFILAFSAVKEDIPGAKGWLKRLVVQFKNRKQKEGNDSSAAPSVQKNYLLNLVYTGTAFLFPFLTFKYASGIIHPVGTGKVSFATSVITYFNMFAQLGIPTYGVRAIAKCRDDKKEMSKTAVELLLLNLIVGAVSYVLLYLSTGCIAKLQAEQVLLFAMCPLILCKAIGMEWLYKGLEQYKLIAIRGLICQLIAFVMLFFMVRTESDYVQYGVVTVIATSAAGIFNFIHSRKLIDFGVLKEGLSVRRHLKPVLLFFAMTCAITVYTCLDATMLGFMTADAEVGYYDAAVKIKYALSLIITSLGTVILPRASYYVEKGLMEEFRDITKKALSFVLMLAIPCTVFFIIYAREGIYLISGPDYAPAIAPMIAILPALIPIAMTNVFGIEILVPTGREKEVLYSTIAGVIIDLILNLILIPKFGATGAAIGTLAAEVGVLLYQAVCLRTDLRDYLASVPFARLLLATAAGTGTVLVARRLLRRIVAEGSVLSLCIGGALFFGLYGVIVFFSCRKEVMGILGKKEAVVHEEV